jgi:beta-lactamase regulating signal transducer with metallopeptidase domain
MELTVYISALIHASMVAVQGVVPGGGDALYAACRAFSQQAAAIAVTAVWQGATVACGLAICLHLAPRTSAEHRFTVWAAAFATIVSLPLLALISGFQGTMVANASDPASMAAPRPSLSIDARWGLLITALWAVAALFRAGDLALHSFRLRKLWKDAIPVEVDGGVDWLPTPAASAWRRGSVQVCTTTTLQRPSVIGFFKPRILIPDWLFARLTRGELEQIVLHEAEHLRRRDDWTNLFQKLCLVLFPLNPALVWIERRLCREREMACDEGVIRITRAPRAYAACLASLAERGIERRVEALSLGAWQHRPELVHRVHSILRSKRTLGPLGARALLGAFGCGLLFGSIELARCPQLIAFVPTRDQDRNGYAADATAPVVPQVEPVQLSKAAYGPVRRAGAGQALTGIKATKIEAVPSADPDSELADERDSIQHTAVKQDAALVREASNRSNSRLPQPVLLKAEVPNSNPASAQEQQWIVLTGWEQIQASSQDAGVTADYETGAIASTRSDAQNKDAKSAQPGPQQASHITITRLILRIYPASSISAQAATASTRGGWIVFQL